MVLEGVAFYVHRYAAELPSSCLSSCSCWSGSVGFSMAAMLSSKCFMLDVPVMTVDIAG